MKFEFCCDNPILPSLITSVYKIHKSNFTIFAHTSSTHVNALKYVVIRKN
jgi:hypothetical protein